MLNIQGYVATVTTKGKRRFAKFGGGLTSKFDEADVCGTAEDAWKLARSRGPSIYDLPGVVAVDDRAQIVQV